MMKENNSFSNLSWLFICIFYLHPWPRGTNVHYWSWPCSASFACEWRVPSSFHPWAVSLLATLTSTNHGESRYPGTAGLAGRHSCAICYPPCSRTFSWGGYRCRLLGKSISIQAHTLFFIFLVKFKKKNQICSAIVSSVNTFIVVCNSQDINIVTILLLYPRKLTTIPQHYLYHVWVQFPLTFNIECQKAMGQYLQSFRKIKYSLEI